MMNFAGTRWSITSASRLSRYYQLAFLFSLVHCYIPTK